MSASAIEISDVGPVQQLTIPVHPGVVVLRGPNDCGKSETLKAVSRLAGGNDAISCREKAASGSVEGLGVKITVRQSARRSGELEALSIEGKLSIADLVSPPIKDPAAADRHRIKALLQLTGVEADWAMFAHLHGVRDHISHDSMECDDLVEMAAKIKRDLEAASRKEADAAEKADSQAAALKQSADGVDSAIETDGDLLQAALEDALYNQGQIVSQSRSAEEAKARAVTASERLSKKTSPPDVEGAEKELADRQAACDEFAATVRKLEEQLVAVKAEWRAAEMRLVAAAERVKLEKAHAESVACWKETIGAAASVECPTPEQIEAAATKVKQAREAIEKAAVARQAKKNAEESRTLYDLANSHRKAADQLRDAARATDNVLSDAVDSDSLTVKGGRLVTKHSDRGEVFYAERSDGTRWKIAIDEAIKRIRMSGDGMGLIPIPQASWSELDPANKAAIHEYAVRNNVVIVTAEATDGELRAEAFEEVTAASAA